MVCPAYCCFCDRLTLYMYTVTTSYRKVEVHIEEEKRPAVAGNGTQTPGDYPVVA